MFPFGMLDKDRLDTLARKQRRQVRQSRTVWKTRCYGGTQAWKTHNLVSKFDIRECFPHKLYDVFELSCQYNKVCDLHNRLEDFTRSLKPF